jgi:signal transduction histidine kinase
LIIDNEFSIEADLQKLTLALKNLVRNAQEATGDDGQLTITAVRSDKGPQIVIQDTGHGMTQRFIDEELFRPFATTKDENGVGIGAYLTKSYLEHLGAQLTVTSREEAGSRFEITFSH